MALDCVVPLNKRLNLARNAPLLGALAIVLFQQTKERSVREMLSTRAERFHIEKEKPTFFTGIMDSCRIQDVQETFMGQGENSHKAHWQ
jgi:hypothetical protein